MAHYRKSLDHLFLAIVFEQVLNLARRKIEDVGVPMVAPSDKCRSEFSEFDVFDELLGCVDSKGLPCSKGSMQVDIEPIPEVVHG